MQVFVLWPGDGTWYRGKVRRFNPENLKGLVFYLDTEEKEHADFIELVSEGQIAFSELFLRN